MDTAGQGFDEEEWPLVAHAEFNSLAGEHYVHPQLHLRCHDDGRLMVDASVRDGADLEHLCVLIGVPEEREDVVAMLATAAKDLRGNSFLIESCMRQLDRPLG